MGQYTRSVPSRYRSYNVAPGRQYPERSTEMSAKQRQYIESLLSERLQALSLPDLNAAATAIGLDTMTRTDAGIIIDRLLNMPKDPVAGLPAVVAASKRYGKGNRPGTCHGCGHLVPADTGYYFLLDTGKWAVHHADGACSQAAPPPKVEVTEGLYMAGNDVILVYTTKNGRLAGKVLRGHTFRYQQGAAALAATGRPVTADEARQFGIRTGNCIACGKDLDDPRSNPHKGGAGYGPVCAKRYGWPWGEVRPVTA